MCLVKMSVKKSTKLSWLKIALMSTSICVITACSDSNSTSDSDNNDFVPVLDPNDSVPPASDQSIARTLLERRENGTLLMLIEQAELTTALEGDNNGEGWTLFAFSDNAFQNEEFMTFTDEQGSALVRGHLYSGRLFFSDIQPGVLPMSQGSVEVSENEDGTISIGGATVIARDREFSNGIIHFVDSVMDIF